MFKNILKKKVIPITIVALILVVGVSLFFKVSSVYKKKTIISTYQSKSEKTVTSDGSGCEERFLNWLGFDVTVKKNENGKIVFTIKSGATEDAYAHFLKESGYSGSVTYKYVIKKKSGDKYETVKSDIVTIDTKEYTSLVVSDEYSSNGEYKISIYNEEWVRNQKSEGAKGLDPGYSICPKGDVHKDFDYSRKSFPVYNELQDKDVSLTYTGDVKIITGDTDKTPDNQGRNQHVKVDNITSDCKLPNNSQANKYLFEDTSDYTHGESSSKTFNDYLNEYNHSSNSTSVDIDGNNDAVSSVPIELVCDYRLSIDDVKNVANSDNVAYSGSKINEYKYDSSNTHYYKGTKTEEIPLPDYEWNTAVHSTTDNSGKSCSRICTEIVKVEYGAPVYVSAGMCFQYRMKISSIVQCQYDDRNLSQPSKKATICQPVAYCIHGSYTSVGIAENTQAGPNEDFEACINNCDGGKYTSECSKACYNLVYEKKYSNDLVLSSTRKPTKTAAGDGSTTFFYYQNGINFYNPSAGAHDAVSVGTHLGYTLLTATGYSMQGYEIYHGSSYQYIIDRGIPRAYYGYDTCHEVCGWAPGKGCGDPSNYYFEGDTYNGKYGVKQYAKDYEANVQIYNNTLNQCKAKATCVSSTAYYTVKTKYVDSSESELKVSEASFPWSSPNRTETKSPSNSCMLSMTNRSPVISFGGCYVDGSAERWYQAEMTFPGVYLDYKHNITKVKKSADGNDIYLPGRMCVNESQGNTNAVWAAKFDEAIGGLNKEPKVNVIGSNVSEYWSNTFKDADDKYTSGDNSVQGYNIYGMIRDFGYFKWNFNISCFYALYVPCQDYTESRTDGVSIDCSTCSGTTSSSSSGTAHVDRCYSPENASGKAECENELCTPKDNYTVRSFNASDPLVTNTTNRESDDIQYKESEIRGYNWTSAATLRKMSHGYNNDPEKLIEHIIANQNTIFDNNANKPNYVIVLDKDTIRNIKRYNKDDSRHPYSTFTDSRTISSEMVNKGGVYFYFSSFLHDTSIFTSNANDIPSSSSDPIYSCNFYENEQCVDLVGGE